MKRKPHHILEGVIVVLTFSIVIYYSAAKAIQSQHRAQISQLEKTMQYIKTILQENPNDSSFLRDHLLYISGNAAGPSYNQSTNELTLFHYYGEYVEFNVEQLKTHRSNISFEWDLSDLQLMGYAVYAKKSQQHTKSDYDTYSDRPAYVSIVARVGENLDNMFIKPYSASIGDDGNFQFRSYNTPFDPSNGLKSYGEFFVDTADIWDATTAVVLNDLHEGFNPKWFPGFDMDKVKIVGDGDL